MKKLLFSLIVCIALVGCDDSSSDNNSAGYIDTEDYIIKNNELKALLTELDNKDNDYTVNLSSYPVNYIENVTNERSEEVVVIGTLIITGSKSSIDDIMFLSEVTIGSGDANNPFTIPAKTSKNVPFSYGDIYIEPSGSVYAALLTGEEALELYNMAGRFMAGYDVPTTDEMLTILKFVKPYIIKIGYQVN